jgi:hypothetical protein
MQRKQKNVARSGLDAVWWRMSGKKCMIIQGKIDQLSHYSDIKLKSLSKHQFIDAFFNGIGDIAMQFEGVSTQLTILWHEIIHASKSIMLFGDFTQGRLFTSLLLLARQPWRRGEIAELNPSHPLVIFSSTVPSAPPTSCETRDTYDDRSAYCPPVLNYGLAPENTSVSRTASQISFARKLTTCQCLH